MKVVLDVKANRELQENDLIVYKKGGWFVVSKKNFFDEQLKKNYDFKIKIEELQNDLKELAKIVKGQNK